ncbi:MAG TPA: hypothetical protein VGM54_23330 [Chthoniobacter sp.]|jgi:hypothetical protein
MRTAVSRCRASALIITLSSLAILAIAAAYTLRRVSPRFQMASQAAAWQEARLAAESGIDVAMADLTQNAVGTSAPTWPGWQQEKNGIIGPVVDDTLGLVNSLLSLLLGNSVQVSSPVVVSPPIFLDNMQIASPGNRPTNVDVQLWALYPTTSPYYRWYRLRAMATCALPPTTASIYDNLESVVRRYSLRSVRPQLRKDDVGTPMSVPTPNSSRVVEVLVEPVLPFELAILTNQSLSLATNGSWNVDSYDSRDPSKSGPGGSYPGRGSPLIQSNGNIANNAGRPASSLYGSLISANGCAVLGGVATNGGDDPSTPTHENVAGATQINADSIRDDFFRAMKPMGRPTTGIFLPPPPTGIAFTPQGESSPAQYLVTGNLNSFSVAPWAGQGTGAVTVMVNGDLDVPTGTISVPSNVIVCIYVRGNIDFHNRPINQGGLAAQLQIYGEETNGSTRTLSAFGQASICAAFYGPEYDVQLSDQVEWFGAVAAQSFQMLGGGTGGFHYDEALGTVGNPIGFRIARYVEDVRE